MDLTPSMFLGFVFAGFISQLIGSALGMGYGVSSSLFLLSLGLPPIMVSVSINVAEIFTSPVSAFSHWRMGNIDRRLFAKLATAGMVGALIGASILTFIPGGILKPFLAIYLFFMGGLIIYKAYYKPAPRVITTHIFPLGVVGGFLDAIGGGGWGTVVSSTLLARGNNIRQTVGSTNSARWFVSFTASVILLRIVSVDSVLPVIIGLIVGGVVAAPIGALFTTRVPTRILMVIAGTFIVCLSLNTMFNLIFNPI